MSELPFGSKLDLVNIYSKINNCIGNEQFNIFYLEQLGSIEAGQKL